MEKGRLEELRNGLYSTTFLIGSWKRKKALARLAEAIADVDAAMLLAEAMQKSSDGSIKAGAKEALLRLKEQKTIDQLCALWEKNRAESIAQLIREAGWVASTPLDLQVLTALKARRTDLFSSPSREVLKALFTLLSDVDTEIASEARRMLVSLRDAQAQQILLEQLLSDDHKELSSIVREAGYAPSDNGQKSLVYFLTEQWDLLEKHDPEHSYLRAAYGKADKALKSRIDAVAERSGKKIRLPQQSQKLEQLDDGKQKVSSKLTAAAAVTTGAVQPAAAAAVRREQRLLELSEKDWAKVLELLEQSNQRLGIWQLAHDAPARWSVQILNLMKRLNWKPRSEEKAQYEELLALAERCNKNDFEAVATQGIKLEGHTDMINCLTVIARDLVATGSADSTVRLWSISEAKEVAKLEGHTGAINCIAYSESEKVLASGGSDGTVRLWRLPEGELLGTLKGHSDEVSCLALSPDGRLLASGSLDNSIRLWVLPEGRELKEIKQHQGSIWALAFSPDGRLLASGGGLNDHCIKLWSVPDCSSVKTLEGHKGLVRAVIFSSDAKMLLSGSSDNSIKLWEVASGTEQKSFKAHKGLVHSLSFLPKERLLSASVDNTARVWSLADGKELRRMDKHKGRITSVAIEPTAKALASASWDNTLKIWDLESGAEIRTLNGHTNWVTAVALSPDAETLVSGSRDNTLRLWKMRPILLVGLSASHATDNDLAWIQNALRDKSLSEAEQRVYAFVEALIRWKAVIKGKQMPRTVDLGELSILLPE
ncbi:MAG: WD40 repeat domain-containing protein [Acidobacteriota bacterium]|nr:WD40 repeat domain-containing protein [Blastocatellia bacterium]MDW8411516.1 WD40 repeat domain-containing protein [Acidobacteriota bacterium]